MSSIKNFVTVTDRSTKALVTATTNLDKTIKELHSLSASSEALAQEIGFRQNELSQIDVEYAEKLAEAKSNLRIKTLDNEEVVLGSLLKDRGLITVEPATLDELRDSAMSARADQQDAIDSAVAEAVNKAQREMHSRIAAQEAQHRVEIAELTANSRAKDDRVEMLTEQLKAARSDLEAERNTRLAIAQAESQRQGVVVNAGK